MKYNDETQRVTRRNMAVSLGLAILLAALILVSAVIYGCNRPQEVVKPPVDTQQPEQPGDVTNDIGDELSSGIVYPMPKSMLFSSPTSESAVAADGVTLQATVLPSNAADLSVNWTVAFVNPSAAWAAGKNPYSYVAVVSSSPGSAIATVTCLKAFGEQIVIEVSSLANPDAAASCVVDYHWRFQEPVITMDNGAETLNISPCDPDNFDSYSAELALAWGDITFSFPVISEYNSVYTISRTQSPATMTWECHLTQAFVDYLVSRHSAFSSVSATLLDLNFPIFSGYSFWDEIDTLYPNYMGHLQTGDEDPIEFFWSCIYGSERENISAVPVFQLEVHISSSVQTETYYYLFRTCA